MSDDVSEPGPDVGDGFRRIQSEGQEKMISNVIEPVEQMEAAAFPELSDELEQNLVKVFKLLADETRLRILMYLMREKELHVTALCSRLKQSQPAVSHHLALLREAGLIEPRRAGKHNFYSVRATHFHAIIEQLFRSMRDPQTEELRFDDFILTHDD